VAIDVPLHLPAVTFATSVTRVKLKSIPETVGKGTVATVQRMTDKRAAV
jgi:hypothetical protein